MFFIISIYASGQPWFNFAYIFRYRLYPMFTWGNLRQSYSRIINRFKLLEIVFKNWDAPCTSVFKDNTFLNIKMFAPGNLWLLYYRVKGFDFEILVLSQLENTFSSFLFGIHNFNDYELVELWRNMYLITLNVHLRVSTLNDTWIW